MSFSKLDYCQYLVSSQVNYTLTHLAEHLQSWSHDTINRYLGGEQLTPRLLWENARQVMESDSAGAFWHGSHELLVCHQRLDAQH